MTRPFHLSVGLDAVGWHSQAWRELDDPGGIFGPRLWLEQVQAAEEAGIAFVTIEDSLHIQSTSLRGPDDRTDQVRGRLDAVLLAARLAPTTRSIGIVPVATTTHTEPFHVSKAIATLDFVSDGRAGVQVRISPTPFEAAQFGRRRIMEAGEPRLERGVAASELFEEAADFVEVARRLWDSWEDDAEIRDVATGRFVERGKLHYIDFRGRWFSVRGPSITPRPPQGQPVVMVLAHVDGAFELAARSADVVFVTPRTTDDVHNLVDRVRRHEDAVGRSGTPPLRIFADLVVFLDTPNDRASVRKRALDELDGRPMRSDASIFVGSSSELLDRLTAWSAAGLDGVRLRPGTLRDSEVALGKVAPVLAGSVAREDARGEKQTLRTRLGLPVPANRYVAA